MKLFLPWLTSIALLPAAYSISLMYPCAAPNNASCKPVMVVAEGPTGSGKTVQEQSVQQLLDLKYSVGLVEHKPQMLRIDDFVEADLGYRAIILAYLKEHLGERPTKQLVDQWLNDVDDAVYDYFATQYFGSRKDWGCNFNGTGGCEAAFNRAVENSLEKGHNVIWEVTGKSYPAKEIRKAIDSPNDYEVVVGLNVVEFCELQRRNSGRVRKAILKFMARHKDPSVPAPRFPDLTQLGARVDEIVHRSFDVIDCVGQPVSERCSEPIEEVYVFSNEHRGFMPTIKVQAPRSPSAQTLKSFEAVKTAAKTMLAYGLSKPCPSKEGRSLEILQFLQTQES